MSGPAALDLADSRDSAEALIRVLADLEPDRPVYAGFGGHAFGVRGDIEPLQLRFGVEGVTITRILNRDPMRPARAETSR